MQQRRVRLGDILDDYCPRERRITNHIVLAMIDDEVKQTRCATCDADHDYKQARIPPQRRKRPEDGAADPVDAPLRPRAAAGEDAASKERSELDHQPPDSREPPPSSEDASAETSPESAAAPADDDGPVHRRLIRATLPRPEGQVPERKSPDFTVRQPGTRGRDFDGHSDGNRPGRPPRPHGGSQTSRFGAPRHGSGSGQPPRYGSGQGPRHGSGGSGPGFGQGPRPPGNHQGHPGGPRGNRPGSGTGRGGRKRGR